MRELPGAGAVEGVAGCPCRQTAATRGQSGLCVAISLVGKVGEGADPGSVGVEKLHRSAGNATVVSAR